MPPQPTGPPTTATTTTTTTTTTSTSKPPVTLPPSTHLDSGAYVRGTHAITLGEDNLIHARAQLIAIHGPLIVSDRCIISEKCIIGGPVPVPAPPSSTTTADAKASPSLGPATTPKSTGDDDDDEEEPDPVKTLLGNSVYIHAGAHVHAGATIQDAVILEPNVSVLAGVTVGAHSKVCAGLTVERDVAPWTVVMGNGDVHRRRGRGKKAPRPRDAEDDDDDGGLTALVETMRLQAMDKEREGTVLMYRTALRVATLAKKK
ncbi:uncharacterized protein A1O9_05441 [Exophiala aquamarina CBS 119918]|uniref:Dynactin subunit 6 n=1 Tax=Exophiala aquamarina CBS 119918 TaxID=1182545 RepID=A0A072PBN6_9EURO|nr:uncharacterized protein A1O9_05441 [Exophiala aquamarina CBS 119918]KEF57524.1 hypothetical protein A1O9_05441 [Exophiala aquamarina CBS 119918]